MQLTWDNFERFKTRGLDARRAGQWDSARVYFLEAARVMVSLGKEAKTDSLKEARQATAQKLLDLARDCEDAKSSNRKSSPPARGTKAPSEQSAESAPPDASQWLVREKPTLRFDDVAGLDDVKGDIRLKMLYPFEHPELAKQFDIRAGGGVLLYGPPGTGKTMLARATAGEIDASFFVISPADILSKWVGEAEQNIKALFDEASQQPRSIIFIDEIEALVPARRDEGSSVMQRVVPQILQSIEGFKKGGGSVLLMGATNVPWQLDTAMLRPGRFDEKIFIPLPDREARLRLLDLYLSKRPLADDVHFESLVDQLEGYSGADVRYLCDRAAVIPFMQAIAASSGGGASVAVITMQILKDVIAETPRSVTSEMLKRFESFDQQR